MNPDPLQQLLITCEHAARAVPARWAHLFRSPPARAALRSHRGWDPGAAALARALASLSPGRMDHPSPFTLHPCAPPPCLPGTATRLLVELNRSPGHPQFWSEFTRDLPPAEKSEIIRTFYDPFRRAARAELDRLRARGPGPVFHLSVHTFTPELDGVVRDADIGLLYDPARPLEVRWADAWESALGVLAPGWRVRRNVPYRGTDDGHVTHLRTLYPPGAYVGFELEVSQTLAAAPATRLAARRLLARALRDSLW